MQEEPKQPGLSWSIPKNATPATAEPAPSSPAAADTPLKLEFPSSKKLISTQMPVYAGLLVVGIMAGVVLATSWSFSGLGETSGAATSTSQAAAASASTQTTPKTTPTDPAVFVGDQPAGTSVVISQLNIARPTWVVVYVSREGKPGNALGARLFFAGDKQGKVGLLRNTLAGQSYFVGLSVDNGDRTFSLSKDKPLADADGGPLWATFKAQ